MDHLKTPEAAPARAVHAASRKAARPHSTPAAATFGSSTAKTRVTRHPGPKSISLRCEQEERADLVGLGYASPNRIRRLNEFLVFQSVLALPGDFLSDDRGPAHSRYLAADAVAKAAQELTHISPKEFV